MDGDIAMAPVGRSHAKLGGEYNQALQALCAKLNGTDKAVTAMASTTGARRLSQVSRKSSISKISTSQDTMRAPGNNAQRVRTGSISHDHELKRRSRTGSFATNPDGSSFIKKNSRQFNTFWRDKIEAPDGDNRRHIPLVANMKGMLLEMYSHTNELERTEDYHHVLEAFLKHMKNDDTDYDVETAANKVLNVLTNLHSHIFLGRAEENQFIGSMSNSLFGIEDQAVDAIDAAMSKPEVETAVKEWRNYFKNKKTDEAKNFQKIENPTARQVNHHQVSQRMFDQMLDVTSGLKASEFDKLKDFKQESRAMIRHLRDSYSTDISDAGHQDIRKWQNQNWLPLHQKMMNIIEKPSMEDFKTILNEVSRVEHEFADKVSLLLKQKGLHVESKELVMNQEADLYPEDQRPLRESLSALIQQAGQPSILD